MQNTCSCRQMWGRATLLIRYCCRSGATFCIGKECGAGEGQSQQAGPVGQLTILFSSETASSSMIMRSHSICSRSAGSLATRVAPSALLAAFSLQQPVTPGTHNTACGHVFNSQCLHWLKPLVSLQNNLGWLCSTWAGHPSLHTLPMPMTLNKNAFA